MLQNDNRLTKPRDFNLVLKYGRWFKVPDLTIKVLDLAKNTNYFPKGEPVDKFQKQLRIAIATGLKLSKIAVVRNRIRRQVREVVRLLILQNKLKAGYYVLIVPEKTLLVKDYAEISEKVTLLLKQSGVCVR